MCGGDGWNRGDREGKRHRMTLEALADVDAGRLIDHRTILAWADGLSADEPGNALPPPLVALSIRDSRNPVTPAAMPGATGPQGKGKRR